MPLDHLPDRAISIRQPWAWAIMSAGKDIENRPRNWTFRGEICIHAGIYKAPRNELSSIMSAILSMGDVSIEDAMTACMAADYGGIIGTATVVDCVTESDSPWFFGTYGLVLENVQTIPFIPVKGALGPFKWKRNLI